MSRSNFPRADDHPRAGRCGRGVRRPKNPSDLAPQRARVLVSPGSSARVCWALASGNAKGPRPIDRPGSFAFMTGTARACSQGRRASPVEGGPGWGVGSPDPAGPAPTGGSKGRRVPTETRRSSCPVGGSSPGGRSTDGGSSASVSSRTPGVSRPPPSRARRIRSSLRSRSSRRRSESRGAGPGGASGDARRDLGASSARAGSGILGSRADRAAGSGGRGRLGRAGGAMSDEGAASAAGGTPAGAAGATAGEGGVGGRGGSAGTPPGAAGARAGGGSVGGRGG